MDLERIHNSSGPRAIAFVGLKSNSRTGRVVTCSLFQPDQRDEIKAVARIRGDERKRMQKKFVLVGGGLVFLGSANTIAG